MWVEVAGGWEIKCDRCGYQRGSYYEADGGKPFVLNDWPDPKPFKMQRVPRRWGKTEEGLLCVACLRREQAEKSGSKPIFAKPRERKK